MSQNALQAGSLDYDGPRQIYRPAPIILATNSGSGEALYTSNIRIPVPSSQCRIKITVMFVPASGALPNLFVTQEIWVAAADQDWSGAGGGRLIPITDLEGTEAAPTGFPQSADLGGYSRSFVTTADWLIAQVSLASQSTPGAWLLQTLIQPDATTFVWEAWDQIRRAFIPQADTPGVL